MTIFHRFGAVITFAIVAAVFIDVADADEEDLAMQLSNPISSLISIPIEWDYNSGIGPVEDGTRNSITLKPVVPISLSEKWNLITRTIVAVVDQEDIFPGAGDQSGLSDTFASAWFSPKQPTSRGYIWGLGAAMLLPTASDDLLGADKWALGPTVVTLKQSGPWTIGFLGNHVWDFAGKDDRADVNNSFLQPFVSYTTPEAVNLKLETESTYNWDSEEWTVPIILTLSKVKTIGSTPVQFRGSARYWADTTVASPEGWGFRLSVVILKPK